MNYSYEGRVIWHDLSPPIQELLKRLSSNLNNTQNTNFLDLLNQEINRAKKKEQEIYDDLMDEIMAIWGDDGKLSNHNITEIWKKLANMPSNDDLMDEIRAIWGDDGKLSNHNITKIWEKLINMTGPNDDKAIADYGVLSNKVWIKFNFGLILQFGVTISVPPKQWAFETLPIPFSGNTTFASFGCDNGVYALNDRHFVTVAPTYNNKKIAIYCEHDANTTVGWLCVGI